MATADDTTSTDWIWLREALALAVDAFGSEPLAEERLKQWLAAGDLPWICMDWLGLDAEGIARVRREFEGSGIMMLAPSAAYYEGDPRFWGEDNNLLNIDWEQSSAGESGLVAYGAQARGIKVPRARLLTLLPGEPHENEQQLRGAGAFIAAEARRMKAAGEIPSRISDFARELERRLKNAAVTDKSLRAVGWRYIKNKLPEWGLWPVSSIPN